MLSQIAICLTLTTSTRFETLPSFPGIWKRCLRYFQPISFGRISGGLAGKKRVLRTPSLLTFDDGLSECYQVVAPILKEKGIPATFFLCSAFVDNHELAYRFQEELAC